MRILIAGASGFVGHHLIEHLQTKKNRLFGTYRNHFPKKKTSATWIRCDFSDFDQVLKLIQKTKPSHIYHLVGQSSPSLSWKFPLETMQDNAFSFFHLLEACRRERIRPKILLVSSAHVYGRKCFNKNGPSEKDVPQPMDPYAHAKLQAEQFAKEYWKVFRIPTVIVRASAHIGTHQETLFAISNFSKQIAEIEKGKRKPVITVGNLKVSRGFVDVKDMVRAHEIAIQKGKPGEIYNIAASTVRPMSEWLQLLLRFSPATIKTKVDPERLRIVEPLRLFIKSDKFRKMSGWRETTPPEITFSRVLNWWRKNV